MSTGVMGILVGGVVPAILFGLFAIFTKFSSNHSLSLNYYLIVVGIMISATGLAATALVRADADVKGVLFGAAAGLCWALGMIGVTVALEKFAMPISILTPLYNMNTLVAVALGLWIFQEWRTANVPLLVIGALLVTIGGVILSKA